MRRKKPNRQPTQASVPAQHSANGARYIIQDHYGQQQPTGSYAKQDGRVDRQYQPEGGSDGSDHHPSQDIIR
ncbi:hypothetical protein [Serratia fonticola]|uniref:hypothetical protein n=1 Tax=Serratia fonticola TaxID=47917 RepID=UPI0021AE0DA0|nr:hypothetical protein [Serratia fonticola]